MADDFGPNIRGYLPPDLREVWEAGHRAGWADCHRDRQNGGGPTTPNPYNHVHTWVSLDISGAVRCIGCQETRQALP
jgi:hypothetical protein